MCGDCVQVNAWLVAITLAQLSCQLLCAYSLFGVLMLAQLLLLLARLCSCVPLLQEWTGEANIGDALAEVAGRLPLAKLIISTQGARGSICLLRTATNKDDYDQVCWWANVDFVCSDNVQPH